jgi:lysophospholipid acyltransferase (LPLAT)-like uncharacterized protein
MITWHGRMIVPVWFMRRRGIVAMISRHSDGEMVSRLVEKLGYGTIRGSSTRGGTAATLEMLEAIRDGKTAAMICDGPRGPIYKMKPGAPYLTLQSGATVITAVASANRAWTFRSWDRFQVPKPFARVYLLWGSPMAPPPPECPLETLTQQMEDALNAATRRADELAAGA